MTLNFLSTALPCKNSLFTKYLRLAFLPEKQIPVLSSYSLTSLTHNLQNCTGSANHTDLRHYCSEERPPSPPPSTRLPPLMNFPQIVWPSVFKSIRNFILSSFIIKPYFDREFSLVEFIEGSKKALEVVSHKIAEGDFKSLEGLVTNDVISEVKRAVALMNLTQREQIAVSTDDLYLTFPYEIGIIFDEEDKDQKRFVEITMVFHALRGLAAMKMKGEELPLNIGTTPEFRTRISISNYRFIREYTKGVESEWTINMLNHFKPSDELED